MADQTYVAITKMGVKDAFDRKYKSSLPSVITAVAEKAVKKSSKLTTKKPKDKKAEGFYLSGGVVKLECVKKGKGEVLKVQVKMQLATWPKKSMFGFTTDNGSYPFVAKSVDADVKFLVETVVGNAMKSAVKELEKRAK